MTLKFFRFRKTAIKYKKKIGTPGTTCNPTSPIWRKKHKSRKFKKWVVR